MKKKKVITNNESEDSEYTMSQMERDELERLREENKNLTELVQDQARDIFELKNILDEIRNNKASSDIYIFDTPTNKFVGFPHALVTHHWNAPFELVRK